MILPVSRFMRTVCIAVALCISLVAGFTSGVDADGKSRARRQRNGSRSAPAKAARTSVYRSRNFVLTTDLDRNEVRKLLARLETMLGHMTRHWGQPNRRVIEIHVIGNLSLWPAGSIAPEALPLIKSGGGVTISSVQSLGQFANATAVVWAAANRGTPLHEAVHAYCAQAFGTTGPVWYSEGMAEIGQYWENNEKAVNCSQEVIDYLRENPPKPVLQIVDAPLETTADSWQNYAWRWALCHVLNSNDNYRTRFRALGMDMLTRKETSFRDVFGGMAQEISFEYNFFLEHLDRGFRADLCRWDWNTKYRSPRSNRAVTSSIKAGRGWQPSRLRVRAGERYEYSASGTWKTSSASDAVDADGEETGLGKLVGILFNDYTLGPTFELGATGSFVAAGDGNLLLRCRDEWNQIADNSGRVTVRLKLHGQEPPLREPEPADDGQQDDEPPADGSE